MALIFGVRGNSLDARYASGDGIHGQYHSNLATLETSGWTGEIGASSIKMRNGVSAQLCALLFPGRINTPAKGFSILVRAAVSGTPGGTLGFTCLGSGVHSNGNTIQLFLNGSNLQARWNDAGQNARVNLSSAWTPTINTFYDIFFRWDGTTTSNKAQIYIDGVLLVQGTSGLARPNDDRNQINYISIGSAAFDVQNTIIDVNEYIIWDSYEDPTNIGLTSGTGSLNGSSRTAFVNCAAFNGATYTDPGITNIRNGTAYTFAGASETGSLIVPSLANTKTGVAGDGGNGTYDGSDRWTDAGQANVRNGTAYKANSTSNNKTGSLIVPSANDVRNLVGVDAGLGNLIVPTTAQVQSGVLYDSNGSLIGTYAPTCDYPAISNVKNGVIFNNGGSTGTFKCYNVNPGPGTAAQLTEKARSLILNYLKSNIHAELQAIRTDRNDPTVAVQDVREWFIYDGAHTYQCPALFVVADSVEIPDEKTGTNMITATMKFFVSAVVEGQDAKGLTILTERYQSALFKLLHWQTLQDTNFNVKDFIRVVRFQFSPLYTKERKGDNMGSFRKEVSLELEVKHYENPTT